MTASPAFTIHILSGEGGEEERRHVNAGAAYADFKTVRRIAGATVTILSDIGVIDEYELRRRAAPT
ncbi:MAG: hypothetical protein IT548_05725 [Alphaproteobacteria bacterium]|nr:hypothetical protein [Alphaproteobacteria bacterium]